MDRISKKRRSWNMSRIRSKDTNPEKLLRSRLHALGFRYHLHTANLPGKPDIVFPSKKVAVLVHGCFWHGCRRCNEGHIPKSNAGFWRNKIKTNRLRDRKNNKLLKKLGWRVVAIWECELKRVDGAVRKIISKFK